MKRQEICVGICWRDEKSLEFYEFALGVSMYETDGACHKENKERPFTWWCNSEAGAILGDPREAVKFGTAVGYVGVLQICTSVRWQLDLLTDLKAGIEGVRYEADTDTDVRFDRGQHGIKTSLRTQDAHEFPWRRRCSHAERQGQSCSNKGCRSRVQIVGDHTH